MLDSDQVYGGSVLSGTVVTKPPVKKASVRIEGRISSGKWQQLATTNTNGKGRAAFKTVAPQRSGDWQIRALVRTKKSGKKVTYVAKPRALAVQTEELIVAETTESIPEGVAADPSTAFEQATGDLTFPDDDVLDSVVVGDTLVVPPGPGFSSGLLRRVTAIEQTGDTVTYETVQGRIADVLLSVPADQAQAEITLEEVTLGGEPCPECTSPQNRERQAARRVDTTWNGPGFTYPVLKRTLRVGNFDVVIEGQVKIDTFLKVAFDTNARLGFGKIFSDLMSYDVAAHATYESNLSATWSKAVSTTTEAQPGVFPLGKPLEFKVTAVIGALKIPMDISFQPQLELEAMGEIKLSAAVTHSAEALAGVRASRSSYEDPLVPEGYTAAEKEVDRSISLEATGQARAAFGVAGAIDFYSLGGPRVTGGWQLQGIARLGVPDEDNQTVLSCEMTHGPFTEGSLGLSDAFLTAVSSDPPEVDVVTVDWDQNLLYRCPDGTNPPEIGTLSLKPASIGEFYLDQLDLTDEEDREGAWSATGLPDGLTMQEGGSLVGTPAEGTTGTYQVKFLFEDEKGRKGRETLELVVSSAAQAVFPIEIISADIGQPMDISRFSITGPSQFSVLFHRVEPRGGVPSVFFYYDLDGDDEADYLFQHYVVPGFSGEQGVIAFKIRPGKSPVRSAELENCFGTFWKMTDFTAVTVEIRSPDCLPTLTSRSFDQVRMRVAAVPTYEGGYSPGEEDWAPGKNDWTPAFAMNDASSAPVEEPVAGSTLRLIDAEADAEAIDIQEVVATGHGLSDETGRLAVSFAESAPMALGWGVTFFLDVNGDPWYEFQIGISTAPYREQGKVTAILESQRYGYKVARRGQECLGTPMGDADVKTWSISFDGRCLERTLGHSFQKVRMVVEAGANTEDGAGEPDYAPDKRSDGRSTFSPTWPMVSS